MIDVPAVVRNKARAVGAEDWLERLPALVSSLEADWSITVGHPYEGGTEAFVADATRADGTPAVLKVLAPGTGNNASDEAAVLRLVGGHGCPVLYRYDPGDGALLMERLGRPMSKSLDCRSPVAWRFFALPLSAYGGRRQTAGCPRVRTRPDGSPTSL